MFEVQKYDSKYKIEWPAELSTFIKKINCIEMGFKKTKAEALGIVIKLHGPSTDTLWIDDTIYFQKSSSKYIEYLYDMYVIVGIEFKDEPDANIFANEIHKKYMWKILKNV